MTDDKSEALRQLAARLKARLGPFARVATATYETDEDGTTVVLRDAKGNLVGCVHPDGWETMQRLAEARAER